MSAPRHEVMNKYWLTRSSANSVGEAFNENLGLEEAAGELPVPELVVPSSVDDSIQAF
jgi:hypothetical protein